MPFSNITYPNHSGVKAPIVISAQMDPNWQTYDDYYVKLVIEVEEVYRSGVFTEMDLEIHQRPGVDNMVSFNVARLLEGKVSNDRPDLQAVPAAYVAGNVVKRFSVRLEEIKDGLLVSQITSPVRQAYLTGFKGNKLNELVQYVLSKKFLTHQPLEKVVSYYQPEYLFFIASANDTYTLMADLYHKDGSVTVGYLPGLAVTALTGDVIIFPVGYLQLGLENLGPPVEKWDIYLDNSYSEKRTYELDCYFSSLERFYLIANSLGGFDTVRTKGELKVNDEVEGQRVELERGFSYDSSARSYKDIDRNIHEVCVQHTGHISREENYWLKDLLLSEDAYRIGDYYPNHEANGDLVPIVIEAGGTGRYQDQEFLYGFPFTYREAFDSRGI
jgi:hypothetical protein